jgi:RNA polymerase sigma-70 factor (ECF subfamily)
MARSALSHSFTDVFSEYGAYVLGLVRRLGVQEREVEDVAQEVFVIVHRQLAGFDGRSTLKTWVCGIALRVAANHRRKAYRRRERPDDFADGRAPLARLEATQEQELDRLRQAEALQRALDALTDKLREVFVLYEIEELPMLDVARALGIPRFTAYSRLREGRMKVAAALLREGHVSDAVLSKALGGAG